MTMLSTPVAVLNLGCQMLFVLEERLRSQEAPPERTLTLLSDLAKGVFATQFIEDLFRPQARPEVSKVFALFDAFAHSSVMTLSASRFALRARVSCYSSRVLERSSSCMQSNLSYQRAVACCTKRFDMLMGDMCSMDRLFDLMCGGTKLMICMCNSSAEIMQGSVEHMKGVLCLLRNAAAVHDQLEAERHHALALAEACKHKLEDTYSALRAAELDMLRTEVLSFFLDCRVKVSHKQAGLQMRVALLVFGEASASMFRCPSS
jgi:hypothetical protein